MAIAGWAIGFFVSIGYKLPFDEYQLTEFIATILFMVFAFIDAKYPNTFAIFGNNNPPQEEDLVLNPEYEYGDDDGSA